MDLISSQPVSISTPRSSRSRVSNFFSLKKSSSSKDLSVLYHGPLSPPPSAVAEAWSPTNASSSRFGKSIDNPEYVAGERRGNSGSVDREREREREWPKHHQAGLGIAFPSSPRTSPTPQNNSNQFTTSPVHRLAGLASGSTGLPTAYIHGGNSPLFSNQTFLPASMQSPPITSPTKENSSTTNNNFNHHSPGLGYTYRGQHGGYSYPTSVPMNYSNSTENHQHHSRNDPNQTTTTSASIRTTPSSEYGDRSAHTSMTSLRTYPSVPDLRNKQRTHAHSQSQPLSQPSSQAQLNHSKNVSFSSIKNQTVSKPPLLSPIAPSQTSASVDSQLNSTPSFSTPNQLQTQQQEAFQVDPALQEAQRRFFLLQQLHLDELTAHSVEASGWLEPGNGCEAVFAPRPRLRNSLDSNFSKQAPRMHSKSMSDTGRDGNSRQYGGRSTMASSQDQRTLNFERNRRPVEFNSLRVRSASNPNPHSTFNQHAQRQVQPPVPQVPNRDASLRSSHARINNGKFSYDADQEKPFFHHRMPPEPPLKKNNSSMGRNSLSARSSSQENSRMRRKSSGTLAPTADLSPQDPEATSYVSTVLAEGKALDQEREQWRREHQRSFGSSTATSLGRRSKSRERSKSRNSTAPIRARDIWNDEDYNQDPQLQDFPLPIPVHQMNNVKRVQIPEMRINNDEFPSEKVAFQTTERRIRPVKSSPQLGASAAAEKDWGTSVGRENTPSPPVPRGLCGLPSWIQNRQPSSSRPSSSDHASKSFFGKERNRSHGRSKSQEVFNLERNGSVGICGGHLMRKKRSSQVVHPSPPGSPSAHQRVHMAAQRRYRSSGSWDVAVTGPSQNPMHLTSSRKSLGRGGRESRILDEPVMINRFSGIPASQSPTFKDQATSPGVGISNEIFSFPANQQQVREELLRPVMDQAESGSGLASRSDQDERSRSVTPSDSNVGIALVSPSPAAAMDGAFESNDNEKTPTRQGLQKIRAGRHPTSVDYQSRTSSDLRALARGEDPTANVFLRSKAALSDPSTSSPSRDRTNISRRKPIPSNQDLPEPPLVIMNSQRPLRYQRSSELLPALELKRASSSASGDFPKNPESLPVPPRRQRSSNSLAKAAGLSVNIEKSSGQLLENVPFQTPTLPSKHDEGFGSFDSELKPDNASPFHPRNISDNSALSVPNEEARPDSEVIPTDGTPSPTEKRPPSEEEGRHSDLEAGGIRRSQSRSRKQLGHSAASSISSATQAGSVAPRERWIVDDDGSGNDGNRFDNLWFRTPPPHSRSPIHREEVSDDSQPATSTSLHRRRDSDVVAQLVQSSLQSSTRVNSAYDPALGSGESSEGIPFSHSNDGSHESWRMGRFDHQVPDRKRLQSHGSEMGLIGGNSPSAVEEIEPPHFSFAPTPSTQTSSTPAGTHGHGNEAQVPSSSPAKHQHKTSDTSFIDMEEEEGGDTSGESPLNHNRFGEGFGQQEGDVLQNYQHVRSELLSPEPAPHQRSSGADYFDAASSQAETQVQDRPLPSSYKRAGPGRWPDRSPESDGSNWI